MVVDFSLMFLLGMESLIERWWDPWKDVICMEQVSWTIDGLLLTLVRARLSPNTVSNARHSSFGCMFCTLRFYSILLRKSQKFRISLAAQYDQIPLVRNFIVPSLFVSNTLYLTLSPNLFGFLVK